MISYLGEDTFFDFLNTLTSDIKKEGDLQHAQKLIVSEYTKEAVAAIQEADKQAIPILAVVDGYQALVEAYGGKCEPLPTNSDGLQEWCVIDATSPLYLDLESVVKVCRAKPVALCEECRPELLDVMSRAETGEVLAVRKLVGKEYQNVFAVNFHLDSPLTVDGKQMVENFLKL